MSLASFEQSILSFLYDSKGQTLSPSLDSVRVCDNPKCNKDAEYLAICSHEITPHVQAFCLKCVLTAVLNCGEEVQASDDILFLDKKGQQQTIHEIISAISLPDMLALMPTDDDQLILLSKPHQREPYVSTEEWKSLLGKDVHIEASKCGWDTRIDYPVSMRNFIVERLGSTLVARGYRHNEYCLRGLSDKEKEIAVEHGFMA